MKTYDLEAIIDKIRGVLATHKISDGRYARFLYEVQDSQTIPNPYGLADAANILYSIGEFPRGEKTREVLRDALRVFQVEDGMYRERTHIPMHTTAHCMAALPGELYTVKPLRLVLERRLFI